MTKRISSAWPYMGAAAGTMLACGMILAAGETIFSVTFDSQSNRSLFRNKSRSAFAQHDPAHRAAEDTQAQLWFEQTRHAEQIRSYDGLKLHAWRFDANTAAPLPHTHAICMHGYTGGPEEMAPWAYHYTNLGMRVLVPAQRAHELSEGRFVGMGWLEREDLLRWVNSIVARDPDARILLHGNSMAPPRYSTSVPTRVWLATWCAPSSTVGSLANTTRCSIRSPQCFTCPNGWPSRWWIAPVW